MLPTPRVGPPLGGLRPEAFVQSPRTPSREPTAMASCADDLAVPDDPQNAAQRRPSAPHVASPARSGLRQRACGRLFPPKLR